MSVKIIDIETIPNPEKIKELPALGIPDVKYLKKDTEDDKFEKVAAAIKKQEEERMKQISDLCLNPFTGMIAAYAVIEHDDRGEEISIYLDYIERATIQEEERILKMLFGEINNCNILCTFNGKLFDIPYIYKRALVHVALYKSSFKTFNPLTHFTKIYSQCPHLDLRLELSNYDKHAKGSLAYYAKELLGKEKECCDGIKNLKLIESGSGDKLAKECLEHTYMTRDLYYKCKDIIF